MVTLRAYVRISYEQFFFPDVGSMHITQYTCTLYSNTHESFDSKIFLRLFYLYKPEKFYLFIDVSKERILTIAYIGGTLSYVGIEQVRLQFLFSSHLIN